MALILLGLPALSAWATIPQRICSRPHGPATRQRTHHAQREQTERRPPAQIRSVLAVERDRVPLRVGAGRIPLAALGAAATLASPAHRCAFAPEAWSVAEEPAAQHDMISRTN